MIGLGVFDSLARDIVDSDTGEVYPALSCYNDKTMADRCTVPGADKVIWSIKASASLNSDCAFMLREGFRSGKIRLLVSEFDADEELGEIKGYQSLSPSDKTLIQMPYINTTLLIDELVKLQHEESGGKIKISEKSGMRKDRYSSLSYNFYVASQLETKIEKRSATSLSNDDVFSFRAPSHFNNKDNRKGGGRHTWNM